MGEVGRWEEILEGWEETSWRDAVAYAVGYQSDSDLRARARQQSHGMVSGGSATLKALMSKTQRARI